MEILVFFIVTEKHPKYNHSGILKIVIKKEFFSLFKSCVFFPRGPEIWVFQVVIFE